MLEGEELAEEQAIVKHPESVKLTDLEQAAVLTCTAKRPIINVSWFKNGMIISSNEYIDIETYENETRLVLNKFIPFYIGTYHVVVDDVGSRPAQLSANIPPQLKERVPSVITHQIGKPFDLLIKYTAYPTPQIKLLHQGQVMALESHIDQYEDSVSVRVKNLKKQDEGEFTVILSNEFGKVEVPFILKLVDTPLAPKDVRCVTLTPTTVTLEWDAPQADVSDIIHYVVERRTAESGRWRKLAKTTANGYTCIELVPKDLYAFRIKAVNKFGEGMPSNVVEVEMPDEEDETLEEAFDLATILKMEDRTKPEKEEPEIEAVIELGEKEKTEEAVPEEETVTEDEEKRKDKEETEQKVEEQEKEVEKGRPAEGIMPAETEKPEDKAKAKEAEKLEDKAKPKEEEKPKEKVDKKKKEVKEEKPAEEVKPEEKAKPKEAEKPEDKVKPKEEEKPKEKVDKKKKEVKEEKPAEEVKPEEKAKPKEAEKPEDKVKPKEEEKPKEKVDKKKKEIKEEKPAEEVKPAEAEVAGEKDKATEEGRAKEDVERRKEHKVKALEKEITEVTLKEEVTSEAEKGVKDDLESTGKKKKIPGALLIPDEISTRFGEPSTLHSETNITTKITAREGSAEAVSPLKQPHSASIAMKVDSASIIRSRTGTPDSEAAEFTFKRRSQTPELGEKESSTKIKLSKPKDKSGLPPKPELEIGGKKPSRDVSQEDLSVEEAKLEGEIKPKEEEKPKEKVDKKKKDVKEEKPAEEVKPAEAEKPED
ncbi:hypothetical protein GCK32_021311, partial [Trichostrongylus colubriformis]